MIADEIRSNSSIIRIHDEYCSIPNQGCISHINQIVTNSYKRRSTATAVPADTEKSKLHKLQ